MYIRRNDYENVENVEIKKDTKRLFSRNNLQEFNDIPHLTLNGNKDIKLKEINDV